MERSWSDTTLPFDPLRIFPAMIICVYLRSSKEKIPLSFQGEPAGHSFLPGWSVARSCAECDLNLRPTLVKYKYKIP